MRHWWSQCRFTGNDQRWSLRKKKKEIHKDGCHREWQREVEGAFGELPSWSRCPWQMASETWAADVYDCLLLKTSSINHPSLLLSFPHPVYFGLQLVYFNAESEAVQHRFKAKERVRDKYQKNNPQIIISIINNKRLAASWHSSSFPQISLPLYLLLYSSFSPPLQGLWTSALNIHPVL